MINKGIILLLGFLIPCLATALQPVTGEQVCNRLNMSIYRYDCFNIVQTSYIDVWAAGVCDTIPTQANTVDCMRVIANKSYLQNEAMFCDSYIGTYETINCLSRYGRPVYNPYPQPTPGPYPSPYPQPNPPYPYPHPQPQPTPQPVPGPVISIEKAKYVVELLYQGILFRGSDSSGQSTYTSLILRKGMDGIREAAEALANSAEWRQNVQSRHSSEEILSQMYQVFFGRGVDSSGYGTYIPMINGGQQARVAGALVTSSEFRQRNNLY